MFETKMHEATLMDYTILWIALIIGLIALIALFIQSAYFEKLKELLRWKRKQSPENTSLFIGNGPASPPPPPANTPNFGYDDDEGPPWWRRLFAAIMKLLKIIGGRIRNQSANKMIRKAQTMGLFGKICIMIIILVPIGFLIWGLLGIDALQILFLWLIVACLVPFVVRKIALNDQGFFTFGVENHIKAIDVGGDNTTPGAFSGRMIAQITGYTLDLEDGKSSNELMLRKLSPNENPQKPLFAQLVNAYWIGISPIYRVHTMSIEKVYERISGTGPTTWLDNKGKQLVPGLRASFPRPYVFTDIELSDGFTIHLKIVVMFRVVYPYIPIYVFNGDFFDKAASILQSEVLDLMCEIASLRDFVLTRKGEANGFLSGFAKDNPDGSPSELNKAMIAQVGLRVTSISVNDWEPGSPEMGNAIRQQALAREEGKAKVEKSNQAKVSALIDAEKDAEVLGISTTAQVGSQNALTTARANRIRETLTSLVLSGSDPTATMAATARLLTMEAATSETSKLTTFVESGAGAPVVVPIGGDKK